MRIRLPRVRVRLWWLMVAVVVAAMVLGVLVARQRREAFLRRAADLVDYATIQAAIAEGTSQPEVGREFTLAEREQGRRMRDYYAALRTKYERAARFPWLPVAPDPPPPD